MNNFAFYTQGIFTYGLHIIIRDTDYFPKQH
jgi:hypothetical protein